MADSKAIKNYKNAMAQWGKDCAKWQLNNPDKDLVDELYRVKHSGEEITTSDLGPGSNPPPPPPPPPPL